MTATRARAVCRGITLIEAVVAIVVLGIAIPPFLMLFSEVATKVSVDTSQAIGIQYADSLMEEIVSKAFEEPALPPGSFGTEEGSRAAYDDVDDFDGLNDSPPRRIDGSSLSDYAGFTSRVTVDNVTAADLDPAVPAARGSTDFKRITVALTWTVAGGGALTLKTLRTRKDAAAVGPLDETASAASAAKTGNNRFALNLINTTASPVQIASFRISASRLTPPVTRMLMGGLTLWNGSVALPTGTLALNAGTSAQRTIPGNGTMNAELRFNSAVSLGPMVVTLVIDFTSGPSSTMTFTINW